MTTYLGGDTYYNEPFLVQGNLTVVGSVTTPTINATSGTVTTLGTTTSNIGMANITTLNAPTGRTGYVIAASDAPASVKAQANAVVSTSVSTLINAAISAGYRDIELSEGITAASFPITTNIYVPSQVGIHGRGEAVTYLTQAYDGVCFIIGSGSVGAIASQLTGFQLDGANRSYSATSDAIQIASPGAVGNYTYGLLFQDLKITNFKGRAIYGTCFQDSVFRDIQIGECGYSSNQTVRLDGTSTIQTSSNVFYGLHMDGGYFQLFLNNYCNANKFILPKFEGGNEAITNLVEIDGCFNLIDGATSGVTSPNAAFRGVLFNEAWGLHCHDNIICNSTLMSDGSGSTIAIAPGATGYGNKVVNNTVSGFTYGIDSTGGTGNQVIGNHTYGNTHGITLRGTAEADLILGNIVNDDAWTPGTGYIIRSNIGIADSP